MKVEIQWRWFVVSLSIVVLVLLRDHRLWLMIYAIGVVVLIVATLLLLPRLLARAERRFAQDALACLARDDLSGLEALGDKQRLLRMTGRGWVINERLAQGAMAGGQGEAAQRHLVAALERCPKLRRPHLELALAQAEHLAGAHTAAEGRLRALLGKPHPGLDPRPALARVLLEGGEAAEAAALLRAALPTAEPRARAAIEADLTRALELS